MKIGGFQSFTLSDYPGHCAAIVFTIGCNFCCSYCHNKSLLDEHAKEIEEKEFFDFLEAKQGKLDGVVITGGEPTIQTDLENFIRKIKKLHYNIKLDTNGAYPDILKKLIKNRLVDYVAMDIKAPLDIYPKVVGVEVSTTVICDSIDIIATSGVAHLFRITWDKNLLTENDINTVKLLLPAGSNFVVQECNECSG